MAINKTTTLSFNYGQNFFSEQDEKVRQQNRTFYLLKFVLLDGLNENKIVCTCLLKLY